MTVELATRPDVELIHAGTWPASTGVWTCTTDDLAAAVAALECPAVRKPVLKLGHGDPRFSGEPAVGWVDGMRVAADGMTLLGDFTGMPAWLDEILPSAYPDRSIEGQYGFVCQIGHTHAFVVEAVALLGVAPPAVGTLESLNDVAALYGVDTGVAASRGTGTPIQVTIEGAQMPGQVQAQTTVEDMRREFYATAPWSVWIVEVSLDPLELIVCNDDTSNYSRVPVTVTGDKVEFGAPIQVLRQYVDAPTSGAAAPDDVTPTYASRRTVYASREESRPTPPAPAGPSAPGVTATSGSEKGAGMDPAKLRDALGLADDASDVEVQAALAAAGITAPAATDTTPVPPTTPELPEGVTVIDSETLEQLRVAATAGQRADERLRTQDRDSALDAAVRAGKIPPARRGHYEAAWAADPEGTAQVLASLSPGLVPVAAAGYAGTEESGDLDAEYAALFGAPTKES